MAPSTISIRQPQPYDLIADDFVIAGYAAGFEATVLWSVLDGHHNTLGSGHLTGVGSMGVITDFGNTVSLSSPAARGGHLMLHVQASDPSGIHPEATDLNVIPVTLFSQMDGFRLYEVQGGDTLSGIASARGNNTGVDDVFEANRDKILSPDLIYPGQVLRIPIFW